MKSILGVPITKKFKCRKTINNMFNYCHTNNVDILLIDTLNRHYQYEKMRCSHEKYNSFMMSEIDKYQYCNKVNADILLINALNHHYQYDKNNSFMMNEIDKYLSGDKVNIDIDETRMNDAIIDASNIGTLWIKYFYRDFSKKSKLIRWDDVILHEKYINHKLNIDDMFATDGKFRQIVLNDIIKYIDKQFVENNTVVIFDRIKSHVLEECAAHLTLYSDLKYSNILYVSSMQHSVSYALHKIQKNVIITIDDAIF